MLTRGQIWLCILWKCTEAHEHRPLCNLPSGGARRPVIVPRLGCLPELSEPDSEFVYEPGNVADLVESLKRAATADLAAMGAASAKRANANSWRYLTVGTLEVYGTT